MIAHRILDLWRTTTRRRVEPRPFILMYHRVATRTPDPWGLTVSPKHFAEQIEYLARRRRPMRLDAFVRALIAGELSNDAVAVTFDDGYVDNLHHAMPTLAAHRVPATLFLTTGEVDRARPFWWDALGGIVFGCAGPVDTVVRIGDFERPLRWSEEPERPGWLGWETPDSSRRAAFFDLWTTMRKVSDEQRTVGLDALGALLGTPDLEADRAMTRAELRTLVDGGVFELGAHSVSHPDLTSLPKEARRREIEESRRDCEALVGKSVPGFAYPYGDLNDDVRADVVACGFDWACSTRGGSVAAASVDRFVLPRMTVGDWPAARFAEALANA